MGERLTAPGGRSMPSQTLSWHDVFEADYHLPEEGA